MSHHESKEMSQLDLSIKPQMMGLSEEQIGKPVSWRKAVLMTAEIAGLEDKKAAEAMGFNQQEMWSRLRTDPRTGINPDRIEQFMDLCGNELLLHNLAYRRGYRLVEIETRSQREAREWREKYENEHHEKLILEASFHRILTGHKP